MRAARTRPAAAATSTCTPTACVRSSLPRCAERPSRTPRTRGRAGTVITRAQLLPARGSTYDRSHEVPARYLASTQPRVTYSSVKADVPVRELLDLFRLADRHTLHTGRCKQRLFRHWTADGAHSDGLQRVIERSVALVAAYSQDVPPLLLPCDRADADEVDEYPPWWPAARRRRRRTLVGFIRASGDDALVATIHDLVVHPGLQRRGVGRALLHRCVQQIFSKAVYDVGTIAPSDASPFFRKCHFELDREISEPLTLLRSDLIRDQDQIVTDCQSNPSLRKMLLRELEAHSAAAAARAARTPMGFCLDERAAGLE